MPEQVRCVLHNIGKSKMFGSRIVTYNVAVTDTRCIFAKLTDDMLKKATAEANQKGKQDGKGFLSRVGDWMAVTKTYGDRYLGMPADDVIKETRDNFAIAITDIKAIIFKVTREEEIVGELIKRIDGEVTFDTVHGKTTYKMSGIPVKDIAAMREIMGQKVRD